MRIKKNGDEVTFNDVMKSANWFKSCLWGTLRQTDRQHGDIISFTFLFKEIGL
jgi:hypothetical protein